MSSIGGKHMFNDLTVYTSVYAHTHTTVTFIIIFLVGFS